MKALVVIGLLAACGGGSASDGGIGGDGGGADAATGGPHPFGTHGGYQDGALFPSGAQADLDQATADFYDGWKARYLETACAAGQMRVKTSPDTDAYTVSEGHGYGMLVTAIMAGHDPDAQAEFDGLVRYYQAHPSSATPGLMAWAQDAGCNDVMGADSATDGDLDIAYALLLADRQWGSAGDIDYRAAALDAIAAILAGDVHPADSILVGDWATTGDPHYTGTRSSDQMPSHFHAFAAASGQDRWNDVADRSYATIDYLQIQSAPATGLLPDFVTGATGATPQPAPADWLEGADDGHFSWNACRDPWRIATSWLIDGDGGALTATRRITAWAEASTGGDPAQLVDGYALDGTALGSNPEMAFVAPFMVAAMVPPAAGSGQAWLDALWQEVAARAPGNYYGDSIKLLAMVVASGNWWSPVF